MTLWTKGHKSGLPTVQNAIRADVGISRGLDLDSLYDLAWNLAGDESEAVGLVCATLQGRRPRGDGERVDDLRALVVRAYLRKRHFRLACLSQLRRGPPERTNKRATKSCTFEDKLAKLSPKERACLILRERLGLAVDEIAQICGLTPERTHRTLYSARERLLTSAPSGKR